MQYLIEDIDIFVIALKYVTFFIKFVVLYIYDNCLCSYQFSWELFFFLLSHRHCPFCKVQMLFAESIEQSSMFAVFDVGQVRYQYSVIFKHPQSSYKRRLQWSLPRRRALPRNRPRQAGAKRGQERRTRRRTRVARSPRGPSARCGATAAQLLPAGGSSPARSRSARFDDAVRGHPLAALYLHTCNARPHTPVLISTGCPKFIISLNGELTNQFFYAKLDGELSDLKYSDRFEQIYFINFNLCLQLDMRIFFIILIYISNVLIKFKKIGKILFIKCVHVCLSLKPLLITKHKMKFLSCLLTYQI